MTNEKNALKAGLFIVLCILLGVGILIGIRGTGQLFNPMRDITVAFDLGENLGGLKVGDQVRVNGVQQGRVKDIRFVEPDKDAVASRFEVDFTLPTVYDLRKDAMIEVEQGLTGTSNLNVNAFGTGEPVKSGDVLDGQGGALARVMQRAPQVVDTLDATLADARGAINDVRNQVPHIVKRYDSTMQRADEALTEARDIFGDTKTDIRGTMANLNAATGTFKDKLPTIFEKADTFLTKTTETVEGARGTLADIRVAAANTKDATGEAKSLLIRNRSRFDNMIASLRNTSTNLENASSEIRRSPWRLLYQPKADELSNLNIYDSAREFAQAATNLNDAASAVRDASQDPSITADEMKQLLGALDASFAKYKDVESKLWNAVK